MLSIFRYVVVEYLEQMKMGNSETFSPESVWNHEHKCHISKCKLLYVTESKSVISTCAMCVFQRSSLVLKCCSKHMRQLIAFLCVVAIQGCRIYGKWSLLFFQLVYYLLLDDNFGTLTRNAFGLSCQDWQVDLHESEYFPFQF